MLRLIDGFDFYSNTELYGTYRASLSNVSYVRITSTDVRRGGQALEHHNAGAGNFFRLGYTNPAANQTTGIIGGAFYFDTPVGYSSPLLNSGIIIMGFGGARPSPLNPNDENLDFGSGAFPGFRVGVGVHPSMRIQIARPSLDGDSTVGGTNGNVLGSPSIKTLKLKTWYYIEMKTVFSTSPALTEIRVNGETWISQSISFSSSFANFRAFGVGGGACVMKVDDIYFADGVAGDGVTSFLGDSRVVTLLPNANGSTIQFLSSNNSETNYQMVDEIPPDTATYVLTSTANKRDLYQYPNLNSEELTNGYFTSLHAIQTNYYANTSVGTTANMTSVIRAGVSDYEQTPATVNSTSRYVRQQWTTNPSTSTAWTPTTINAAEIGQKRTS